MNIRPVESPCINICELNAADVCIGCGRSLNEIAEWSAAENARKQVICVAAAERRNQMESHGQDSGQ